MGTRPIFVLLRRGEDKEQRGQKSKECTSLRSGQSDVFETIATWQPRILDCAWPLFFCSQGAAGQATNLEIYHHGTEAITSEAARARGIVEWVTRNLSQPQFRNASHETSMTLASSVTCAYAGNALATDLPCHLAVRPSCTI